MRGDLPETVRMLSKSQNLPAKQETFPKTSVKRLTPMGLEFRVEGMELYDEIFRSQHFTTLAPRKTRKCLQ